MSAHHIAETDGSFLLPTIVAAENKSTSRKRFVGSKDFRGAKMAEGLRTGFNDPVYLNPLFGEWAMGFPITFTDSKDWATRSARSRQPQPTDSLEVANV
jgi:hypothetical protein